MDLAAFKVHVDPAQPQDFGLAQPTADRDVIERRVAVWPAHASRLIQNGGIEVEYGNEANARFLLSETVGLEPGASVNGDVIWRCGYGDAPSGWGSDTASGTTSTTVLGKYLPSVCRPG